jgi:hypothetical protein
MEQHVIQMFMDYKGATEQIFKGISLMFKISFSSKAEY